MRDERGLAAGPGPQEQGGGGKISDLFGKGIDNPSPEKSHPLTHPSFKTHIEEVRRETDRGTAKDTNILPLLASAGSGALTKPFPAGKLLPEPVLSIQRLQGR